VAANRSPVSLDELTEAFAGLSILEKQNVWFDTMGYGIPDTARLLRTTEQTAQKARDKGADLLRATLDSWTRTLLRDNGAALGDAARAAKPAEPVPFRHYLDIIDGRMTWQNRVGVERALSESWNEIDRFCRVREADAAMNETKPLTDEEMKPYLDLVGVPLPKPSLWKRVMTGTAMLLLCAELLPAAAVTYNVSADIEFSRPNGESVKLDAHVPEGKGPFPAVILVHGGGWTVGHKTVNFVQSLFPVLDQTGMTWFTIDYRLAPRHPYPAALNDVEAAVTFIKKNARQFKVDTRRIALMGESAGGHLVNLAGARNRVGVAAVVCFYGPVDMLVFSRKFEHEPPKGNMKDFFAITAWDEAARKTLTDASPHTWINRRTPPFLLIHGTRDAAVPYEQAKLHVELFQKRGIPVELYTVEDGVHGVMHWEKDARFQGYKQHMLAWLARTLKFPAPR
jgi:alpha-L-fucosidase 2